MDAPVGQGAESRARVAEAAFLVVGAAGIWLGIHAVRAFLTMVTWNVAEDAPPAYMASVAFGVWAVGILVGPATRLAGGPRPVWRFGLLLGLLSVARQAVVGEFITPALSFASLVLWLWWLPAFLRAFTRAGFGRLIAPAVSLGVAAQVAGQAAMHGLDLPMMRGFWSVLGAALLAGTFLVALRRSTAPAAQAGTAPPPTAHGEGMGAVGLFLFLFLQLTLAANLGLIQMMTGWGLPGATALALTGLAAGVALMAWAPRLPGNLGLGLLAVAAAYGSMTASWDGWLLVPLQALLGALLAASFAPGRARHPERTAVVGGLLFVVLVFLYYSRYGWPSLWPLAVAAMAALAMRGGRISSKWELRPLVALALIALAGVGLNLLPFSRAVPASAPVSGELKVFNYNIHQGLDTFSLPSMQQIAGLIERADADLVALQEVNRGWNLSGGVDLVAWLRWRFPDYHVIYGPMNGELWGNIIMSRYPVSDWGVRRFPAGVSNFPRGLVWVEVEAAGGSIRMVSTHFTPFAGFDADRNAQAEDLLRFWAQRPRTIIAGDFNAHPTHRAIQLLLEGGLGEVTRGHGLWESLTYPAAAPVERRDYIFMSPDFTALSASIPQTLASDHLPVAATLKLRR